MNIDAYSEPSQISKMEPKTSLDVWQRFGWSSGTLYSIEDLDNP